VEMYVGIALLNTSMFPNECRLNRRLSNRPLKGQFMINLSLLFLTFNFEPGPHSILKHSALLSLDKQVKALKILVI